MLRIRTLCGVVAIALAVVVGATPESIAQERPQLPDEVRAFLERDQLPRWARLLETGKELFETGTCGRCHGADGSGSPRGPNLTDTTWTQSGGSLDEIRNTIMWGVRRGDLSGEYRFEMNPSGGMTLEWSDMGALAAYVWSLSNGTHLPSR